MSRLDVEIQRLYQLPANAAQSGSPPRLTCADGRVRALVLALSAPADWATLAPLWRGVQTDFRWPEAGIAVNGCDAFEIWFSLAEPLPQAEAAELLAQLQRRYLGDVRADRVRAWPGSDAATEPPACPPFAAGPERWAAFVTPDLPAVFGDDPALDFEPGAEAQAELLSRLQPITPGLVRTARAGLGPLQRASLALPATLAAAEPSGAAPLLGGPWQDPRMFLQAVMNDPNTPLALRVEAAKALLR